MIAAEPIGAKIRLAHERGVIASRFADQIVEEACAKGVITQDEKAAMERAKLLRRQVVMVDEFPKDLGKTEIRQITQPVTFEALRGRTYVAGDGEPRPSAQPGSLTSQGGRMKDDLILTPAPRGSSLIPHPVLKRLLIL